MKPDKFQVESGASLDHDTPPALALEHDQRRAVVRAAIDLGVAELLGDPMRRHVADVDDALGGLVREVRALEPARARRAALRSRSRVRGAQVTAPTRPRTVAERRRDVAFEARRCRPRRRTLPVARSTTVKMPVAEERPVTRRSGARAPRSARGSAGRLPPMYLVVAGSVHIATELGESVMRGPRNSKAFGGELGCGHERFRRWHGEREREAGSASPAAPARPAARARVERHLQRIACAPGETATARQARRRSPTVGRRRRRSRSSRRIALEDTTA